VCAFVCMYMCVCVCMYVCVCVFVCSNVIYIESYDTYESVMPHD